MRTPRASLVPACAAREQVLKHIEREFISSGSPKSVARWLRAIKAASQCRQVLDKTFRSTASHGSLQPAPQGAVGNADAIRCATGAAWLATDTVRVGNLARTRLVLGCDVIELVPRATLPRLPSPSTCSLAKTTRYGWRGREKTFSPSLSITVIFVLFSPPTLHLKTEERKEKGNPAVMGGGYPPPCLHHRPPQQATGGEARPESAQGRALGASACSPRWSRVSAHRAAGAGRRGRARGGPAVSEEISLLPPVTGGPVITEGYQRQVLRTVVWSEQQEQWAALRQVL